MSWIIGVRARLRQLVERRAAEERMNEEIRFHLEMETEKNLRAGMSPREARRRAALAFGAVEAHKEVMREGRRLPLLEDLWRDVRYAVRSLRKTPGFTLAAILTLALGVGANAAVFGLVSATLLRPLPFAEPERLVMLYQTHAGPGEEPRPVRWSYPEFAALRQAVGSLSHLAAYYASDLNLSGGAAPVRVRTEVVSAAYFPALGVQPTLGRAFLPEEDSIPGAHPVVVLGHALWTRDFGADPGVLGRELQLNGVTLGVVGVMPEAFQGLTGEGELWIPQAMAPAVYFGEMLTSPQHFLSVVGRLPAGVTVEQARAELAAAGGRAAAAARVEVGGENDGAWTAALVPLDEARRDPGSVRARLVLAGAVSFVLLIAAVNLAGLLLVRAVGRMRESAVRAALGASRRRLVRQTLVESGLIGVLGGALGLLIAFWSIRLLATLAPERLGGPHARLAQLTSFAAPGLDWRVTTFAFALAIGAGLLAGLVPALRGTRGDLTQALKSGARGSSVRSGSLRRPNFLSLVAMAQVACALVLLVGAGLLLQGFHRLRSLDAGIDAAGVVSFRISPPEGQYGGEAAAALHQRLLVRVEAVPGVVSATVSRCTPFMRCSETYLFFEGRSEAGEAPLVGRNYVGPDHFRTLGIPLLRGRTLTAEDRAGRARVAVINETAARRFWPGEDPIGKRVWFTSGGGFASPDSLTEIVGVVGDVPYARPGEPAGPDFYTSYLQFTWPATMVIVRAAGDPTALVPALRGAVATVDPHLPIYDVRTVAERSAEALASERFATVVLGVFAALGLLLAALGVYGVMTYSVVQRRREIGIRLALGATPREVLRLVVGHGTALAGAGLAVGVLISVGLARTLSALVADVRSADPLVLLAATLGLLLVALLTAYLPARAATRVNPAETLAAE